MKSYGPSQGFRPPNRKRKNVPDYFPKYYTMDPEAEDVLFGHELRNDMVVMIEGAAFKADLDSYDPASSPFVEGLPAYVEDSALRMNRWMTVNRLFIDERDREIHFIGVYEDGTKSAHSWDKNTGWIVKKLSIPDGWLDLDKTGVAKWMNHQNALVHSMTKEAQARIADELASGKIKAEVVHDWSDTDSPNVVVRLTSSGDHLCRCTNPESCTLHHL